jgi:hypothetical protein
MAQSAARLAQRAAHRALMARARQPMSTDDTANMGAMARQNRACYSNTCQCACHCHSDVCRQGFARYGMSTKPSQFHKR